MFELIASFLPLLYMAIGVGGTLWTAHWLLIGRHADLGRERLFPRQIIMLGLTLVGLLALLLVMPISEGSRNQLIGVFGLLTSGIFAFSSTTIVANLMAGMLLRITKPFQIGDFIRTGDHFGRVSERGLFDTEIQTETRELVSLPNTYLISNPVTTIRSSGTIISTSLSLGYEVHHELAESLLVEAAQSCGLQDPSVQILDLGNFAVTYRVAGFLEETKLVLTARSNLCRKILDVLHGNGIEIMSPSYMNQRPLDAGAKAIPMPGRAASSAERVTIEDIAFDKADLAESLDKEKYQLGVHIRELEVALKTAPDEDKDRIRMNIETDRERLKELEKVEVDSSVKEDVAEPVAGEKPTGDAAEIPH